MTDSKDDLTERAHFDPTWIAWNGGFLHSNNVLFYFATSPFFDQVSGNQSLLTQWAGTPNQNDILGTRAKFEASLRHQRGIQFVVEHDPLEEKVVFDGPNGPEKSNVWVIRKQNRENESENGFTVLEYYYIVNDVIYQAPSVAGVLNYRMLNTVSSLNKIFSAPSDLSFFSASHGRTYHKPVPKPTNHAGSASSQRSKENTPMSGVQLATSEKPTGGSSQSQETPDSGVRTVWDALRMTLQYGKEYADEISLVGEPGHFRFSKNKDAASSQPRTGPPIPDSATPGASRAPSVAPAAAGNLAGASKGSKAGNKAASTPEGPTKPKRRKSKAGEPSP